MGKSVLWGIVFLLFVSFVYFFTSQMMGGGGSGQLSIVAKLPEFSLQTADGELFERKDLNEKISVVNFFYTKCPDSCTEQNAQIEELQKTFAHMQKVQFLSISIQPEADSVAALKRYSEKFGKAGKTRIWLTGEPEKVKQLIENGFLLSMKNWPEKYSKKFVLLDDEARICGFYASGSPEILNILKSHIWELSGKAGE
ncbi:electron transport protein SCO1/SenC [Chloroherpeton thalassium ATCC 35110]|uniref:Electron transport protein SCO1/SenC n=1 Tax=Chloroherpeton thalassium (strain ATCC 35110 / GB-78) TaxID=517418 RepID=B3QWL3_CHLT3|nr:SCO family protein [Chloroherpeton thalassium]ACF14773.1 electron transport protein SCO1/SenC [Chloroherpeton thalassium ATCC 35110]